MILNLFYMISIRCGVRAHEEDNTSTDYRYLCYDSHIAENTHEHN